jgi:hypothetical protein
MSLPSKGEIMLYWKDWLMKNCFDVGEPSCWACRRWWNTKYDVQDSKASWDDLKKLWDKVAPLQRCHIIPRSLGGTDDASNLFLMCRECHDLAPDTNSREMFFKWVESQNWCKRWDAEIQENLQAFGVKKEDLPLINTIITSSEFERWAKDKMGIHGNQKGYGLELKVSTLIASALEYKKQAYDQKE